MLNSKVNMTITLVNGTRILAINTIPATATTEKKAEAVKTALAALSLADD